MREEIATGQNVRSPASGTARRVSLQSTRAHVRRAARGIPRLLRVEGPQAAALLAADSARGRSVDALHVGRHAAAEAVVPRPGAAAGAADHDRAEVLPHARHRRGRARRPPPDLLRDARQLLVRRTTSRTGRSTSLASSPRAARDRLGPDLGDGVRRRPGARARRGRGRDRAAGRRRACRASGSWGCRARRTSGRSAGPGRAGRTPRSTSTGARSTAAATPAARPAAAATGSSSSGTSSSWSTSCTRTAR